MSTSETTEPEKPRLLHEIPSPELIDELTRRFHGVAIHAMCYNTGLKSFTSSWRIKGPYSMILGSVEFLRQTVQAMILSETVDIEGGDEGETGNLEVGT